MLSRHGKSPALMELVVPRLVDTIEISAYSDNKHQFIRLMEMIYALYRNRKQSTLVFIDTFSTNAFWYCFILAIMCRNLKIPYIPILHGGLFEKRLKRTPFFCKQVFSYSAINLSPSIFLKNVFEQHSFKVFHLPNFLELENYPFYSRIAVRPKLLWVRAFHEIYNPFMAVNVVKLLKDKFPDVSLTMVGADKDGSLDKVKKMAENLRVKDHINLTGYLSKSEWINLSVKHDFFLNTSTADNMPVSVMEGMSLGLVVISTNVGGIPYLLQNNVDSYLVNSNDAEAMADRIAQVLESPQVAQNLTSNAREKCEAYSWNLVKEQWLNILNQYDKKS
jgi:glycosyltransferase involved in cell wall biosynthesis